MNKQYVDLKTGRLGFFDTRGDKPAVIFVHSNSGSSRAFIHQLADACFRSFRLIAVDLPGHGESQDSGMPEEDYMPSGLVSVLADVMDHLSVPKAVIVGASLGGNIGLEMAHFAPERLVGLMTIGTAPVSRESDCFARAFLPHPCLGLTFTPDFSDEDARDYAAFVFQGCDRIPDFAFDDCQRSDGSFRKVLGEAMAAGSFSDQVDVLRGLSVPAALVLGSEDAVVNISYLHSLEFTNLWRDTVLTISGAGHAPHWQTPKPFNALLSDFLTKCRGQN